MAIVGVDSGSVYKRTCSPSLAWSVDQQLLSGVLYLSNELGELFVMALPSWQHHKHIVIAVTIVIVIVVIIIIYYLLLLPLSSIYPVQPVLSQTIRSLSVILHADEHAFYRSSCSCLLLQFSELSSWWLECDCHWGAASVVRWWRLMELGRMVSERMWEDVACAERMCMFATNGEGKSWSTDVLSGILTFKHCVCFAESCMKHEGCSPKIALVLSKKNFGMHDVGYEQCLYTVTVECW